MKLIKRLLVLSDIHGLTYAARRILLEQNAKTVIFLGDGLREFELLQQDFPDREFFTVRGNNDFGLTAPDESLELIAGKRVFFTHGHRYSVKHGLDDIKAAARQRGADILLFGHTHIPFTEYDGGLCVMNPGAVCGIKPGYGFVDILEDKTVVLSVKN